jgi:Protein of unknown function (DUF2937)
MRFIARWLSHSLALGLALLFGLAAMQAPASTADYTTALLQVARDARRDVEQREAAARQYYALPAADDAALIDALKLHEPSNAAMIALSLDRVAALEQARAGVLARNPLVQPVVALADALNDSQGYKSAIWHTALETYHARLDLTPAAILYGVVGIALGSLLAHLLLAVTGLSHRRRARYA